MKNKYNLLFAILCFVCILVGYVANFFSPLLDKIYYGQIGYLLNNVAKAIVYIILIIVLHFSWKKLSKEEKTKKDKKELPMKKVIVLYVTTLLFITLISILAGWQLKPLSDLGEKYTGLKIWDKVTDLVVLGFEVFFMMKSFQHLDKYFVANNLKSYKYYCLSILPILVFFSTYRLIVDLSIYQIVFIPFTAFIGFIYPYTEKSFWKTYLISLLVFLF